MRMYDLVIRLGFCFKWLVGCSWSRSRLICIAVASRSATGLLAVARLQRGIWPVSTVARRFILITCRSSEALSSVFHSDPEY